MTSRDCDSLVIGINEIRWKRLALLTRSILSLPRLINMQKFSPTFMLKLFIIILSTRALISPRPVADFPHSNLLTPRTHSVGLPPSLCHHHFSLTMPSPTPKAIMIILLVTLCLHWE